MKTLLLALAGVVGITGQVLPRFEVAAIKATDPTSPVLGGTQFSPNRLAVTGSLQYLLILAYGVQEFQIAGGPKWTNSDRFEIDAKPEQSSSPDQLKLMLRTLLAERFKVVLRKETRELPVYALAPARNGLKIQKVTDEGESMSGGRGRLSGRMTMPALAQYLAPTLGRMVLDRAGVAGIYEVRLEWAPDENASGISIFTAIQEQLGLRLESTKGPVEVLVIDRAEKPSDN